MSVYSVHFQREDYMPRINPKHPQLRVNTEIIPSLNLPKRPLDRIMTPEQEQSKINRANRLKNRENKKLNTSFQNNITPDTGNENDVSVNIDYQSSDEQENVNENNVITEILPEASQENQNNDDIENSNETEDTIDGCGNEFSEVESVNILLELHNKYRETQDQCLLQKEKELCSAFEKKKRVSLLQFLKNDDDLNTFTGINFRLLNNLATAVADIYLYLIFFGQIFF